MKKLLVLLTVTLAMSLFMVSCGDDEPTGPSEPKIGEMTASVGGNNWAAQNAVYNNFSNHVTGLYVAEPLTNPTKITSISVKLDKITGEPAVGKYLAICFYEESEGYPPNSIVKIWTDISGNCEITEITDTEIKGTFTFTGTNIEDNSTKSVSGKFYTPRQ
ncbi:MAG: hypothetical protein WC121_09340 [Candidatus Kapaibacterium sp.]